MPQISHEHLTKMYFNEVRPIAPVHMNYELLYAIVCPPLQVNCVNTHKS